MKGPAGKSGYGIDYIDGVRPPPSASLFLGQRVHWAPQQFHRHRQLGITLSQESVRQRLCSSWEAAAIEAGAALAPAASDQLREQACQIVAQYFRVFPVEPRPVAVECRLEAPLVDPENGEDLGMPLVGVLDLVLPSPSGPVICDFKTSARSAAPLALAHEIQLSCYAYLLRQVKRESELQIRTLVKAKSPKVEIHRFPARTDRQLLRLFGVIREYLDAIHARRFNYRPGWTCPTCDVYQRCAGHVA